METPIIWDSGFGYDIGYLIPVNTAPMGHTRIELRSGHHSGKNIIVYSNEVIPYTNEKVIELTIKYGYETKFLETF